LNPFRTYAKKDLQTKIHLLQPMLRSKLNLVV